MPSAKDFSPLVCYDLTATVANGGTDSDAVDLHGCALAGLIMPAAFTGTSVKLLACDTLTGTYVLVADGAGADVSITVTTSKYVAVPNLTLLAGIRFLKLRSSGAEAAERTVRLVVRPI